MGNKPTIGQQLDEKLDGLATKQDIKHLEASIENLNSDMKSLNSDMKSLNSDMKSLTGSMKNLIGAFNKNTQSTQAPLAAKGIPVSLSTAKAPPRSAGKKTG